ncbi:MAG: transcription-repair coupling factor, partial [Chitinophagaceae bacterium]|nr:transcription-repair coupling factor [Chitinophagaceae bacterium]
MGVQNLLKQYQDTPRLFQLSDRLSFSQPEKIFLKNLRGSSSQFVVAAAFLHPSSEKLNHLIVLNDAEEAAYFHNTLENLTGALDVFYFPDSFKNKKNYRLLNSSHVMLRTEALMKIAAGSFSGSINKKVLITYPEALFEKVVIPTKLSANIIQIKSGDPLLVDELLLKLSNYGFERTDFVYEP